MLARSLGILFLLASCTIVLAEEAAVGIPGVSNEKPAGGPFVEVDGGYMVPYTASIPGTEVQFEMIPIPGGVFKMGSPDTEVGHAKDEGPQVDVKIQPFWMAKTELTWAEYKRFMSLYSIFKKLKSSGVRKVTSKNRVDAITAPTPLYSPNHTYEHGDNPQQPAVTMTQYAAKQYTKWISGMSGLQYRLPSESEWEYAARAGSTTAYSFGDDPAELGEYACFAENNSNGPNKVGTKKPNAFGLHDMHGNVWEWTIDGYTADGFGAIAVKDSLTDYSSIQWPTSAYPRSVRGGGWQEDAERCRSAVRLGSEDEDWKSEDPNIPLSPWWYTTDPGRSVGMRLVRSFAKLDDETMSKFWEIDDEDIKLDVNMRIQEGRGALGLPVPELAEELKANR